MTVQPANTAPPGYQLIWNDEFDQTLGTGPDPNKWIHALGQTGWGNQELELYTNRLENASIVADPSAENGKALRIQAVREVDGSYTSARIHTQDKFTFQYGWVEARLRLPYGQGIWPAFWMVGEKVRYGHWPHCGEIDIMESIGKELSRVHGTIHGPGYSSTEGPTSSYTLPDGQAFKDGYHTFAVEWAEKKIKFFVDGNHYETRTPADIPVGTPWVYDHPFHLLLNLAVGGIWPGYPDATTVFPQNLMVDYVRVYQKT